MRRWPGRGPGVNFPTPPLSEAFAQVVGVALNPSAPPTELPTGLLPIEAIYLLAIPQIDETIVSFGFNTDTAEGAFNFVFKWLGGVWNCWVTMPDGEVRTAGCIPLVFNWKAYMDFSTVIVSPLPVLGQGDLVGSGLLLVKWKP